MAFLDTSGALIPRPCELWFEPNATNQDRERPKRRPPASSPANSEGQYAVVCSEKQAKVVSLPSQVCVHKHNITDASFVLRAEVVQLAGGLCIVCFCANGHIMALRYLTSTTLGLDSTVLVDAVLYSIN